MAKKSKKATRRAFLRGAAGVTIALPLSEFTMIGEQVAQAQSSSDPLNLVTMYFPNGCDASMWNYQNALSPLLPMQQKINVLQGVKNTVSEQYGNDQHLQGGVTLFTGKPVISETKGSGISIDQYASRQLDQFTALRQPLVAGVWRGFAGGQFRSITWFRRSWLEDGTPVTPYQNPLDIYNAIFGINQNPDDIQKEKFQKSTLDFVIERYKSVTSSRYNLSAKSKTSLGDHLDRVRDIEKRAQRFQAEYVQQCKAMAAAPQNMAPSGGIFSYDMFETAYRQQLDLVVLALQCGLTHTASLMFGCAGEEFTNQNISTNPDHTMSHYTNDTQKNIFYSYRRYHMQNILYFLEKMDAVMQNDGKTLLDNSVVMIGSEFGETRSHQRSPQPIAIAGSGGGKLKTGQVLNLDQTQTTNDVLTTALYGVGLTVDGFGEPGSTHNKGLISGMLP